MFVPAVDADKQLNFFFFFFFDMEASGFLEIQTVLMVF